MSYLRLNFSVNLKNLLMGNSSLSYEKYFIYILLILQLFEFVFDDKILFWVDLLLGLSFLLIFLEILDDTFILLSIAFLFDPLTKYRFNILLTHKNQFLVSILLIIIKWII